METSNRANKELIEALELASKMINHVGCINSGCDRKGAIQVAEDEWDQCQWCHERDLVNKALQKAKEEQLNKSNKAQVILNKYLNCVDIGESNEAILKAMEEYSNQSKWISVENRLPNTDNPIIMCGHGISMIGFYDKGRFLDAFNLDTQVIDITHWQPLPQPQVTND